MPITTWTKIIHDNRFLHTFKRLFLYDKQGNVRRIFLPGIIEECRFFERSIYHLDGPGALRHLDSLLGIRKLDAIQWVCGAGNEGYEKWVGVYQKIQAGKRHRTCEMYR